MLEMLKTVYVEFTVGKSNIFIWHKRFKGRDVNDADRQDAPIMKQTDENITDIRGLVWSD